MRISRPLAITLPVVVLALLAFAVPATLAYDAWAWLAWARELLHLDLDTTGGPSWKPLPVFTALPLVFFGDAAPGLWLVTSRIVGLLALVAAYHVARRLTVAPRTWAVASGIVAGIFLVLTPDAAPRFIRLVFEGHSAPWTAMLALGTIDRHLAGRTRQAYLVLVLLSLDRPEAWPFLVGYAVWLWRRETDARPLVVTGLLVVPALWFGFDWWGSGSPIHGADIAQTWGENAVPFEQAWGAFRDSVIAPVWLLSALAAIRATRERRLGHASSTDLWKVPWEVLLVGSALMWSAAVLAMNLILGFAGIARFFLPPAALLCVVAGVELTRLIRSADSPARRIGVVTVLAAVIVPTAGARIASLGDVMAEVTDRGQSVRELREVIVASGGNEAMLACPPLWIDTFDAPRPALAWHLRIPIRNVRLISEPSGGGTFLAMEDGRVNETLADDPSARLAATSGRWVVYVRDCSASS